MSATPSLPVKKAAARAATPNAGDRQGQEPQPKPASSQRNTGFGLPCTKCRTYYSADLKACPVCHSAERMSPKASKVAAEISTNEPTPDPVVLEQEREKFLREFKAQLFHSQMQLHSAAHSNCIRVENHASSPEKAVVCQACYDHLQERLDVLEAALHIDLKEAAQIVYDAVWSDPSDSSKTYENAAHALLSELRKRSGVPATFGLSKPLTD